MMKKMGPFHLALVTGASSGIGEALCHLLASKGINLLITGRNGSALQNLAHELREQVSVTVLVGDLSQKADLDALIKQIHNLVPDLIINNAGFGLYGEALTHTTQIQEEMTQVNCNSVLAISLEAARALSTTQQKGTIINISSTAGFLTFPNFAVYAASKAFVTSLSASLDEELRSQGIRVLAACPGMVKTGFRFRASNTPIPAPKKHEGTWKYMTAEYAAEQVWKQIQRGHPQTYIFNGFYRCLMFLARYITPKKILMNILRTQIGYRHTAQPTIPIKQNNDAKL